MKLGILGDTHYTNHPPERRKDENYLATQMDKTDQAFSIFEENNCDVILQTGDFFDSPRVSNEVIAILICFLKRRLGREEVQEKIECVLGQHDMFGHSVSTLPNTPLNVLQAAGVVNIRNNKWYCIGHTSKEKPICIYGCSFGELIPVPENRGAYNILIVHAMIGNKQLYPGQELIEPRKFLREHPEFRLVVCGDYHYRFIDTYCGRTIVNVGAMVRKTISSYDLEHIPAVGVFDTETNEMKIFELKVAPIKEVFDLSLNEVKDKERLANFIRELKDSKSTVKIGWKEILCKVFEERRCSQEVRDIIEECLLEN